jgi:SAM-dependent methyltransferase
MSPGRGIRDLLASARLVGALVAREQVSIARALRLEREIAATPVWRSAKRVAAELRRTYRTDDPSDALKYTDLDAWLRVTLRRAARVGLIGGPPQRVADLGCGAGIFVYVARQWGHDAVGVDLPLDDMPMPSRVVYQRLADVLEIPIIRARVAAGPLAELPRDLSLVTAFMVTFNRHREPNEWSRREWAAFVDGVTPHLRVGGRVHLELNSRHASGAADWYDAETGAWFARRGTVRRGGVVSIPREPPAYS